MIGQTNKELLTFLEKKESLNASEPNYVLTRPRPTARDVEAEAGSGPFSVEADAEAQKFYRFRFHIGGKNGGRKEIGSDIFRRANRGSINIKKRERGGGV